MERELQLDDRVKSPDGKGRIVGRAELNGAWYVHVAAEAADRKWKGFAIDLELIEAAGRGASW